MAYVAAVGVNDEKDVLADLSNRLHSDFAVISTIILLLQRRAEEDACSVIEVESAFAQSAAALGRVPLKEHERAIYALSVHRSTRESRGLIEAPMKLEYAVRIERLADGDGGGYIATVPDLPGCMSDGETPEEALQNVQEAIASWIESAKEWKLDIPQPSPPLARAG